MLGRTTTKNRAGREARVSPRLPVSLRNRWLVLVAFVITGVAAALLLAPPRTNAQAPAADTRIPILIRSPGHLVRSNYVALSGDIEGSRTASIGFTVPGVVVSVGAEEGDFVRAGQVLAALDTTEYDINVEMASAQRERAEDEYKRVKMLFEAKGAPENDFNKVSTAVRLARAQEALARKKRQDTRLVAPMSGMLARRGIEPGEMAAPGMPVFTIAQVEPVNVRVGVPEADVSRIAIGSRVAVTVPSLRNASFTGRVRLVGIAADPASRTYTAKIEVANGTRTLRPGMIAEVRINGTGSVNALTIPAEAVVRDPSGVLRVFVYEAKSERVYGRRVTVGGAYGQEVEVRDGIDSTHMVVIGGQHRVREGSRVNARVVGASEPSPRVGK
jgi:membrane fusion protein, multidrug efflux system